MSFGVAPGFWPFIPIIGWLLLLTAWKDSLNQRILNNIVAECRIESTKYSESISSDVSATETNKMTEEDVKMKAEEKKREEEEAKMKAEEKRLAEEEAKAKAKEADLILDQIQNTSYYYLMNDDGKTELAGPYKFEEMMVFLNENEINFTTMVKLGLKNEEFKPLKEFEEFTKGFEDFL